MYTPISSNKLIVKEYLCLKVYLKAIVKLLKISEEELKALRNSLIIVYSSVALKINYILFRENSSPIVLVFKVALYRTIKLFKRQVLVYKICIVIVKY